jgi:hypothetical protein
LGWCGLPVGFEIRFEFSDTRRSTIQTAAGIRLARIFLLVCIGTDRILNAADR